MIWLALLVACSSSFGLKDSDALFPDADGDGHVRDEDCDEYDATVNASADEVCDGIDNDCDGVADESPTDGLTFYADADDDGYGDAEATTIACELPSGFVEDSTDCDDAREDVSPEGTELCDGEADEDCDGTVDEDGAADAPSWYIDDDGDGYGVDTGDVLVQCDAPSGYGAGTDDCDDGDAEIHPGAEERCNAIDDDCDGAIPDSELDVDGDEWLACEDCDDDDIDVHPTADEVCNSLDDDCDGLVDDDDTGLDLSTATTWYADADGDGYGDLDTTALTCLMPSGYDDDADDCDDDDSAINPGETEVCNGIDDDCDDAIDDDDDDVDLSTGETGWTDADGDGYGDPDSQVDACELPSGVVDNDDDCDDDEADVSPDATEVCNQIDDDCNGAIDEDDTGLDTSTLETFYADDDGDGFGDPDDTTDACSLPADHVTDDADCDDSDASINPDGTESCDGADEDCDGDTDEGLDGDFEDCPAGSCLDILTADSSAPSGDYWIDFDGTSTETECDMSTDGGGWTLLFEDDFEGGADSAWSDTSTYVCDGDRMLGRFDYASTVDVEVDTYAISHTEAHVLVEYWNLDSWDSEDAWVSVDGTDIWSDTPSVWNWGRSYTCGNGWWTDDYDNIDEIVSHSASTLTLEAGCDLSSDSSDESMAINDVEVWIR